jgi:deoxyribose-phosphate aldolase
MHTEYSCYDISINEEEVKQNIQNAIKLNPKCISIHPYSLSALKNLIPDHIDLSCVIDYPMGLNDIATRNSVVRQVAKNNQVKIIDLNMPSKLIVNRKYDKFREDIKSNLDICKENNINLRYILEYRTFSHEILAKVCQILKSLEIQYVLPSSGFLLDDISDNIIAAKYLMAKSDIKVICNGNVWMQQQVDNVIKSGVHGLRVAHLPALELLMKNKII